MVAAVQGEFFFRESAMSDKPIAVITGGAGNLGSVVTRRFLEAEYLCCVPWHDSEKWEELQESVGNAADDLEGIEADLTDEDDVAQVMHAVRELHGPLTVLLNLVGGFAFGKKAWEMEESTWRKMMDLNLTTAFLCCKHAVPLMKQAGGGRIINVTSKASIDLQVGASAYAVSKAGVTTFTRCLREELKGTGITVNAIMPSIIDTPVTRKLMPEGDVEKWVKPAEIAEALAALCSGSCDAVSGSVLRLFGEL
jgi:NAD(P)-dependent dehydrogenase (short-subunit alcohol dehydrogenase family)